MFHCQKVTLLKKFCQLKLKNQENIKLKAELPILNSTEIDWHENIKVTIEKGALAQLYTEKLNNF